MPVEVTNPPGRLELGLVLPPCPTPGELTAVAQMVDESEVGSLWVTDRTLAGTPWLDALTTLGALAMTTRRVKIGTSVLVLPRRHPVYAAHAFATADHLSGGRVIAGLGVGNSDVSGAEFEMAGVAMADRGRLTDSYVDLMKRLWSGEQVDIEADGWGGRHLQIMPAPARELPVWIGGSTPAARRRAGRVGDALLAVFSSPDQYLTEWSDVETAAIQYDRNPADIIRGAYLFAAIDDDGTSSRPMLDAVVTQLLGAPLEHIGGTCIWGNPEQWIERLTAWKAAGVTHVNVAVFGNDIERDVRLICEQVAPNV